ncbi:tetratricopeptide repeat protein [Streptomyces mirabilis]|uniref:tetratricopeptide repeat protein n=1 Tax=Streptomyces mirabilis TaxID=68239 RepID=UPI00340F6A99
MPLYEATLAQYEQVLGDTHPDTLSSRNNLACDARRLRRSPAGPAHAFSAFPQAETER